MHCVVAIIYVFKITQVHIIGIFNITKVGNACFVMQGS